MQYSSDFYQGEISYPNEAYENGNPEASGTYPARPRWVRDVHDLYRGRVSRQFVLHFNITDFIVDLDNQFVDPATGDLTPCGNVYGMPRPFPQYLNDFLYDELNCQAIYFYSLAKGLTIDETLHPATYEQARSRITTAVEDINNLQAQTGTLPGAGQQERERSNDVAYNLKILEHMLRQNHPAYTGDDNSNTDEAETAPIAVILEYAEKIIPFHLGEGRGTREQLQALEMVQRWGLDPQLRQTNNIVILLTTNIGNIAASVYEGGSGCRAIRVPLPNLYERSAYIAWKVAENQFAQLSTDFGDYIDECIGQLGKDTQGMRLSDIDNLSRRIIIEREEQGLQPVLTARDVQQEKSIVIQAQSQQLLEILQPRRHFNDIGGMQKLKTYLEVRANQMREGSHSVLVPSGLLLAGPPGTGKTIIAEALATVSKFNLVKMRNIQDRWVGSSERNLELVINLLKDLHPVVVFVDEIDQAMARRDSGQSGDSGVSGRMFARILEEMSNAANRGRILWVAATNRVDFLDDALLRRFDRVIPLLPPDADEACRIFSTMPTTISRQSDGAVNIKYIEDLAQSGRQLDDNRSVPTDEDLERFRKAAEEVVKRGMTGAGIEIIVRRAVEIACEEAIQNGVQFDTELPGVNGVHLMAAIKDFKSNHNRNMYNLQSLLAIRGSNFHSILPDLPKQEIFMHIQTEDGQIDPELLERQIRTLKMLANERTI